jgi:predicted nucleic acid-binding protein
MHYYLDTSSVLKLLLQERETPAFRKFVRTLEPNSVHYSFMTKVETLRNLRNFGIDPEPAAGLFEGWTAIRANREILKLAEQVNPRELRTPDAIHLAFALILSPLKVAMVTYDKQLAKASVDAGIEAISPGS